MRHLGQPGVWRESQVAEVPGVLDLWEPAATDRSEAHARLLPTVIDPRAERRVVRAGDVSAGGCVRKAVDVLQSAGGVEADRPSRIVLAE
ncbi:MAG TPA: hypothetical protein VNI78_06255, partial [Vicinamibacterales bacterium]|nr:hypothetical protein [Vicinamibacterales bacterium]